MLRKVLAFVLIGFAKCVQVMRSFVLDNIGPLQITYFHFLLFGIFIAIAIRLINYLKQVQEVESEKKGTYQALQEFNEYKHYEGWLKRNTRR